MTVEYQLDNNALPRPLAEVLRPELTSVATEIVDEIRAKIPNYARPLDGPYGKSIRAGVHYALTLFIDQIGNPDASAQKCSTRSGMSSSRTNSRSSGMFSP